MLAGVTVTDRAAKERACEELLKSRTFARSEQLIQFLRYICELEIDGRGAEITEYAIATNALHRSADYAPGEDSSVRSRAHALRRKLEEYYEKEASQAELRIDLPKGSYRPVFVMRTEQSAPTETPVRTTRTRLWTGLAVLAVFASSAITAVAVRRQTPDPIDEVVREAWGPVVQSGGDVLILMGTPPVARALPSQPGVKPHGNILEPAPAWMSKWYEANKLPSRGGPLYMFPTRGYTLFSDTFAAMNISSLLGTAGVSHHTTPVWPTSIHENGLIIIGAPAFMPYAERILNATPYSIWFDEESNEEVIGDKVDGIGFAAKRNPQTTRYSTVYALITVLPSQPGRQRPERTILFSGIMGSPGPQAAIDYFRSPASLKDLRERFRREGLPSFPPAYQVVVRCGVDSEMAINAVYEAHRVMSTVPVIE